MHLLDLYKVIADFKPKSVVIDPLTSLIGEGNQREIQSMVTRMIDLLKSKGITGFFTSLVSSTAQNYTSGEVGVSSLIDTWIVVRELEEDAGKRRIRGLYIVKSRGMGHSSDVHKLILSDDGIDLVPMDAAAGPNQKMKLVKVFPRRQNDQGHQATEIYRGWETFILTSLSALAAQLELLTPIRRSWTPCRLIQVWPLSLFLIFTPPPIVS